MSKRFPLTVLPESPRYLGRAAPLGRVAPLGRAASRGRAAVAEARLQGLRVAVNLLSREEAHHQSVTWWVEVRRGRRCDLARQLRIFQKRGCEHWPRGNRKQPRLQTTQTDPMGFHSWLQCRP